MAQHPHLIIPTTAEPSRFTSPSSGPRERMNLPTRSRAEHAQNLISKLEALSPQAAARAGEQRALGLDDGLGIYLAFESEPNFDVKFESLDLVQSGIWPAPGSEDTELGVLMELEVGHGETEVYARVQA